LGTAVTDLELGAGSKQIRLPNRLNCDLYPGPNIDVVFDLMKPWPFKDNSIRQIHANHVIEHLPDPAPFMREAWRVLEEPDILAPNLFMRMPYGPSEQGIGDVTHLRMFSTTSFACFWPNWIESSHNLQYQGRRDGFALFFVGLHINPQLRMLAKPIIRRWGLKLLPFLWGGFVEMVIQMGVIKSEHHLEAWKKRPESNIVPVTRLLWEDEYYKRPITIPRRYVAF
jgi:Methyltransferase domain